jgi:para-aminobenzoate synthetase component 1
MILSKFKKLANSYGKEKKPFLFLIDFEMKKPFILPLDECSKQGVYFQVPGSRNVIHDHIDKTPIELNIFPMKKEKYAKSFFCAQDHLNAGNTYLLNITFPTLIKIDKKIDDIFCYAEAQYKLLFKDQFTIFSPECFIRTQNGHIYSYPMKGTIDADFPNAAQTILSDKKETWEHNTIVDLIRNDLAIVARNITVTKFRFLTEIHSNRKNLLQVSSEIRGELDTDWREKMGDMICTLLPAGSISGAPKQRTVEIIREAEKIDRGYFTGIFGVFDGKEIDSAVNIRYIEQTENGFQFRSGGGITANSNLEDEYNEMVDKVYVPLS